MREDEHGVPDGQEIDEPFDNDGETGEGDPGVRKAPTPQQKHEWGMEDFKNNAANQFLSICVLGILILAILDFFKGDGGALSAAVETLKSLAMVAVGFLFGSAINRKK